MVTIDNDISVITGDSITLQWTNSSLLPLVDNSQYNIDIEFYWLSITPIFSVDVHSVALIDMSTLMTGLVNDGNAIVTVPNCNSCGMNCINFIPVFFKVTVNVSSSSSSNPYISALQSLYSDTSNRAGIWSHVIVWKKGNCPLGVNNFRPHESLTCPCTINQANLPGSGFEPDVSPGRRIMDQYLHPTASLCYRSTESVQV